MGSLQAAVDVLDKGLGKQHDGYQLYVSLKGETLLNTAAGEAAAGVPLTTDSLMLWFSSTKPLTAAAIGQLWEQGKLTLDDPVTRFIPEFGQGGKEKATVRHLLTHRGGFPIADVGLDLSDWEATISAICASEAMWEPGTACGYHGTSGHEIMGEIIKRVDGRPVQRYMREQILDPLGMKDSHLGVPAELLPSLRERVSQVTIKETLLNPVTGEPIDMSVWNSDAYVSAVVPGGGGRGPAGDLGKFYEAMVNGGERQGSRILQPQTVETIIACHRRGMTDLILQPGGMPPGKYGYEYPWGLSVMLDGNPDIGSRCSPRVFGHSGAMSSVGFGDPESGLACVIITNGLIPLDQNGVRLSAVADAVNDAIRS
jgi:CubicO group peptidase (beta-lactamase class C family)